MLTRRDDKKKRNLLVVDVNRLTSQHPVKHIKDVSGAYLALTGVFRRLLKTSANHKTPLWFSINISCLCGSLAHPLVLKHEIVI